MQTPVLVAVLLLGALTSGAAGAQTLPAAPQPSAPAAKLVAFRIIGTDGKTIARGYLEAKKFIAYSADAVESTRRTDGASLIRLTGRVSVKTGQGSETRTLLEVPDRSVAVEFDLPRPDTPTSAPAPTK